MCSWYLHEYICVKSKVSEKSQIWRWFLFLCKIKTLNITRTRVINCIRTVLNTVLGTNEEFFFQQNEMNWKKWVFVEGLTYLRNNQNFKTIYFDQKSSKKSWRSFWFPWHVVRFDTHSLECVSCLYSRNYINYVSRSKYLFHFVKLKLTFKPILTIVFFFCLIPSGHSNRFLFCSHSTK